MFTRIPTLLLLAVLSSVIEAKTYTRIRLSTAVTVLTDDMLTIPFDEVLLDRGNVFNSDKHAMVITESGKYWIESHVHMNDGHHTIIEIVRKRDGVETIEASCTADNNKTCKLSKRTRFDKDDEVYIKVEAMVTATVLTDDTYMYLASR